MKRLSFFLICMVFVSACGPATIPDESNTPEDTPQATEHTHASPLGFQVTYPHAWTERGISIRPNENCDTFEISRTDGGLGMWFDRASAQSEAAKPDLGLEEDIDVTLDEPRTNIPPANANPIVEPVTPSNPNPINQANTQNLSGEKPTNTNLPDGINVPAMERVTFLSVCTMIKSRWNEMKEKPGTVAAEYMDETLKAEKVIYVVKMPEFSKAGITEETFNAVVKNIKH